jgi:rhodanese-related sulfurtransferase
MMKRFSELVAETAERVNELFPWDLEEILQKREVILLDVREPIEYEAMHIAGSINVPRGVLETACEYDYEETVPELVEARDKEIIVICRSGNRSVFVCDVMQQLGYRNVSSLKTGLRGWSDYEQPLVNLRGESITEDDADAFFTPNLRPEQLSMSHKQA